ncbi:MAG TPA: hypothetical protein VL501_01345, partial [Pyrinomonadaceae bacterium]|nr:hypothetical protein [Pyrinomonadaceae bacterium]
MRDTVTVPEVEAFFAMPDEKDNKQDSWSMPEPVFRTSEGRSIKTDDEPTEIPESELPTEIANRDLDTEPVMNLSQTVRPKENRRSRHQNKRKKSYWERNAAGLIVLAVLLIGLLIYL